MGQKQPDLSGFVTKDDIGNYVTKDDVKNYVTKDDIGNYVTKDDVKNYVTKDDVKNYVTKDDVKNYVTRDDFDIYKQMTPVPMNVENIIRNNILWCADGVCKIPLGINSIEINPNIYLQKEEDNRCIIKNEKKLGCYDTNLNMIIPNHNIPLSMPEFGK
jgi:hypothetical protein